jgi:large subunit ribosomal protein L22
MEIKASIKFVRMSPYKARDLARALRGLTVEAALQLVQLSERKAARQLEKALESAIANAENNAKLSAETLFIREAVIEQGPTIKRYWPRSRGMVSPIRRRMSHVRVTLTDEKPAKRR